MLWIASIDYVIIAIGALHFGVPFCYYLALKGNIWKPWLFEAKTGDFPKIEVLLPTFNEASLIRERLENLAGLDYPEARVGVTVVDSSIDGTSDIVSAWKNQNPRIRLKMLVSRHREGKLKEVLTAMSGMSEDTDIVILTDADAEWPRDSLKTVAKYFTDSHLGAMTSCMSYGGSGLSMEETYSPYYNVAWVPESRIHSTPLLIGPFLALRMSVFRTIGFPDFEGSDDSAFGSFFAFSGYRSIQTSDIVVVEPIRGNQVRRRVRRAQHLIQNFLHTKRYAQKKHLYKRSKFDSIWRIEFWFHIGNPFLFAGNTVILVLALLTDHTLVELLITSLVVASLASQRFRTWALQQVYLITAMIRSLWTRDPLWSR